MIGDRPPRRDRSRSAATDGATVVRIAGMQTRDEIRLTTLARCAG
jgi:hypothetical protein